MNFIKLGVLVLVGAEVLLIWLGSTPYGSEQQVFPHAEALADRKSSTRSTRVQHLPIRVEVNTEATRHARCQRDRSDAKYEEIGLTSDRQMTRFLENLSSAVVNHDGAAIEGLWQTLPHCVDCIKSLQGLIEASDTDQDLLRYAAEALIRIGTQESVDIVLDQALQAQDLGNHSRVNTLLNSLDSPPTLEAARSMLELLSSTGLYSRYSSNLPDSFAAILRKTLRKASDRERVGELAAELYLDMQRAGRKDVLLELLNGVAHPNMFSALAIHYSRAGSQAEALQFLTQISLVDDPGAVQALIQAGSTESELFRPAAQELYQWSRKHPESARAGMFLEYLNDSERTSNERILGAYGLAGLANIDEALQAYAKTQNEEANPRVRNSLDSLKTYLSSIRNQQVSYVGAPAGQ
jgi:hypothetical protein